MATTLHTAQPKQQWAGGHGGPNTRKKVGIDYLTVPNAPGYPLGNLAPAQGKSSKTVVTIGVGQCVVEGVFCGVEKVSNTMHPVWECTSREPPGTSCPMPPADAHLFGRMGKNMGTMERLAIAWLSTAVTTYLYHVAQFHITDSLVAVIPAKEMPGIRYQVAWHHYHCLHLAVDLRHNPPHAQPPHAPQIKSGAAVSNQWDGRVVHSSPVAGPKTCPPGGTFCPAMPLPPKKGHPHEST